MGLALALDIAEGAKVSCGFQDVEAVEGARRERMLDAVEDDREERKEERIEARENVERRGGRAEWRILATVMVVTWGLVEEL